MNHTEMHARNDLSGMPYAYQRDFIAAWRKAGKCAAVRKNRNGSWRIKLEGFSESDMHAAMNRIERWLATLNTDQKSRYLTSANA